MAFSSLSRFPFLRTCRSFPASQLRHCQPSYLLRFSLFDISPKVPVHTLHSRNTVKSCFWGPSEAEGPQHLACSTRYFHIGSSSFSAGNNPMGWVDSSKGWKPQKVVSPWRAIASIVSSALYPKDSESSERQPGYRGWGSRVILTLQRGTRCFSNSCTAY
jgi:hypothetical protein